MAIKRRNNRRRSSNKPKHQRTYKAVCADCEKEVRLEVPPPIGKPLFCLDCYKK
jgi:CxxC-x17-CxxC domain-containing protein